MCYTPPMGSWFRSRGWEVGWMEGLPGRGDAWGRGRCPDGETLGGLDVATVPRCLDITAAGSFRFAVVHYKRCVFPERGVIHPRVIYPAGSCIRPGHSYTEIAEELPGCFKEVRRCFGEDDRQVPKL